MCWQAGGHIPGARAGSPAPSARDGSAAPPASCGRLLAACPGRGLPAAGCSFGQAPGPPVLVICVPWNSGVQFSQIGKLFVFLISFLCPAPMGVRCPTFSTARSSSLQLGILPHNFLFQGLGPSGKRGHAARHSEVRGNRDMEGWGAKPDLPCPVSFTSAGTQTLLARCVTGLGTSCCAAGRGTWEMDPGTRKSFSLSPEVIGAINHVLVLGQPVWPGCVPWSLWARTAP